MYTCKLWTEIFYFQARLISLSRMQGSTLLVWIFVMVVGFEVKDILHAPNYKYISKTTAMRRGEKNTKTHPLWNYTLLLVLTLNSVTSRYSTVTYNKLLMWSEPACLSLETRVPHPLVQWGRHHTSRQRNRENLCFCYRHVGLTKRLFPHCTAGVSENGLKLSSCHLTIYFFLWQPSWLKRH